jgi:hypothetical protein
MQEIIEKGAGRILWRSFVTSIALAVIETLLLIVLLILVFGVTGFFLGWRSGVAGVNPIVSIIRDCLFTLSMRIVLGFTLFNWLMWAALAASPLKFPISVLGLVNGLALFLMYCVWNAQYQILPELFHVYRAMDIFNIYRSALVCSLFAPLILRQLTWLPTVIPWLLRT